MSISPRLDGVRVYLRPLAAEDAEHVVRWRSDPDVARQLFSERPPTRAEHDAWFVRLATGDERKEFVISLREDDRAIGTTGLILDRRRSEGEYGILIGEPAWRGQGVARESSELLLGYAFDTLGLQAVWLETFADNVAARRLYERLGFVEAPGAAGERSKDGVRRGTLRMRLTRSGWEHRLVPRLGEGSMHR